MSLSIHNLTKVFGKQLAVNAISFSVQPGEIMGFLGPNGAGKSTTMKVASGYISASSGEVRINGEKMSQDNMKMKYKIGYLPEHNPLYLDMYVKEYLEFVGNVYGLKGKHLKNRVQEIVKMTNITVEQNKKIGALSKGYRQRVGLAKSLIHDPPILILDEPTTGLDPNQIIEIRDLIKTISIDKTVIFSTHILQEVQAICDRVIIINKGQIMIDQKADYLQNYYSLNKVWVELAEPILVNAFKNLKYVLHVEVLSEREFILTLKDQKDFRHELFNFIVQNNWVLLGLNKVQSNLESIFKTLTA